jgi:hypothetical protein
MRESTCLAHRSNVPDQKIVGMITEMSNCRALEAAPLPLRGDCTADGWVRKILSVVGICASCMRGHFLRATVLRESLSGGGVSAEWHYYK